MSEEELKTEILKTFNQHKERTELMIYEQRIKERKVLTPMIIIVPSGGHTWVEVFYDQHEVSFTHIQYRYNGQTKTIEL